jgi:mono/diheme cytochrome c family protein
MRRMGWLLGALAGSLVALGALVYALNVRGEEEIAAASGGQAAAPVLAEQVTRGEYLARVGDCMACHTVPGGAPYAGGRGIETPFGVVFAPNLTPDPATGLGRWTAAEFRRAMHNGRSRDGRLLYPAFPYDEYTRVRREDVDAIFAYLQSLPPVEQPRRAHALRFPYGTQAALAVWRALFFTPGEQVDAPQQSAQWNRGAYLVQGLGHCASCHSPRNAWGATSAANAFSGGLIPVQHWYAPALNRADEAGVAHWSEDDVVALLRTGVNGHAGVSGPMAEVVFRSTQYLSEADARAMAVFLRALPQQPQARAVSVSPPTASVMARGAEVYRQHCAECHGEQGRGQPGAFPALAGNRAVQLQDPTNMVRLVLQGGYLPATAGHPRPHGMPPLRQVLGDDDVAAVTSFVRNSWGNQAPGVGNMEVYRARERRGP